MELSRALSLNQQSGSCVCHQDMLWSSAQSSITNTHVDTLIMPIFLYPSKKQETNGPLLKS